MSLFRNLLIEKKRRKYYCEVEYLASDGNQWIDTEFVMESGKRMTFNGNMMWTQSQGNANFFYGYRSVNTAEYRGDMRAFFIYGASPAGRVAIRYGVNTDNSTNVAVSLNTKFNMSFDGDNLKVDGTTYATLTQAYTPANYQSMWLFNCNCTGYYSADVNHFIGRIYNWQIWSGDVLVRDLIPVLDWDMKPAMYDKITRQLFYNKGTGNFTYGREIHYVEYLESTGTQYIDTGVKLTNNHSVELDYQLTNASQSRAGLFGALNMTGSNQGRLGSILSPSNKYLEHGYGAGNDYWQQGLPDTNRHILYQKKNETYFDGALIHTFNTATFSLAMNAYLGNFVYTNYTPALAKYYGSRWWDGDTLVRYYKPAIDENGVGFMFDKVNHTIYDNAGTGAFKYPAREVEYLQSDGARAIVAGITVDDTCGYDVKWMALNSNDTIILGTKGSGDSRWVLSGSNNPNVNISWNTSSGGIGLGLNKIQTAQMNYFNDRKRILNDTPLTDITQTLSANASTYSVGIFGGYWGASSISLYSTCRIYYAKITKGTELIRDFIPMVKDGSPCLFDKIGGLYYFGTGTGTFTTGKIVEPEYE